MGKARQRKKDNSKISDKDDSKGTNPSNRRKLMIIAIAIPAVVGSIIAASLFFAGAAPEPALAIGGVSCDKVEHLDYHAHTHVDMFVDGKSVEVPGGVGILPSNCLYWVHTHSADGVIHIEAPNEGLMTLGQMFDIWHETSSRVNDFPESPTKTHAADPTVYVSGSLVEGNYRDTKIYPNTEIAIVFGNPPSVIPSSYVAGKADLQLRSELLQKLMTPSTSGSGALGDPVAPVTIVEFGDYQCNSCGIFHKNTQSAVISNLVSTGKAQLLFKDFTLNDYILQPRKGSTLAAEAAYCAGDEGKFWQYHDELFNNQEREGIEWISTEALKAYAVDVGISDTEAFSNCLDSHKYQGAVEQNNKLVRELGIDATPTFIFIGPSEDAKPVKLVGAYPYQAFDTVVNQMLTS